MQLGEKLFHTVDHGNDVRAGLPLNIQNDRRVLIGPGGLHAVLDAINDIGHIAEADGRAVAVSDDERPVTVAREQLIVGADGVRLMQAIKCALGHVHVGLA